MPTRAVRFFFVFFRQKLNVQAYHGGEGGDGSDMEGVNVAICTMEKANSIVNRLAEEKRLQVRDSWTWQCVAA